MKAAVLHEFNQLLSLENVPRPVVEPDELLIHVEACGVCHSDVHVADGDWPQLAAVTKKPLILGHEIVGRVAERGGRVSGLLVGEPVGVPWIHWTCGTCDLCREGNENLCAKQKITGVTVDGGFAEFVKAPASHTVKIPDGLSALQAAPLFCAGVTVYRALTQAKISPGQRLGVFGVGGLGHIAVQLGRELGAEIIAIDLSEEKLELAKSLGAADAFNGSSTNVVKDLRSKGGLHIALVTSAAKAAYDMAFSCLRPKGALLVVGLPRENLSFPAISMAAGEVRIQASAVGTRQELREVLAMAAAGKIRSHVNAHPLENVNEVLNQLRHGQVSGRTVLIFP